MNSVKTRPRPAVVGDAGEGAVHVDLGIGRAIHAVIVGQRCMDEASGSTLSSAGDVFISGVDDDELTQ